MIFLVWLKKIPMSVYAAILYGLLCFWGGCETRAFVHRCPVCPKCPEIVARAHIERDSVIIHDTIKITKYAPAIAVKKAPAVSSAGASAHDSVVSYTVIDTMPDLAVIGVSFASRELPDMRPIDLLHTAWYVAKPDRIKIISDTLTVQLPALQYPPRVWREITIGGVCFGIGAAAGIAVTLYCVFR